MASISSDQRQALTDYALANGIVERPEQLVIQRAPLSERVRGTLKVAMNRPAYFFDDWHTVQLSDGKEGPAHSVALSSSTTVSEANTPALFLFIETGLVGLAAATSPLLLSLAGTKAIPETLNQRGTGARLAMLARRGLILGATAAVAAVDPILGAIGAAVIWAGADGTLMRQELNSVQGVNRSLSGHRIDPLRS
ncbi:MAG: hypothetical protein AAF654_08455 [Myxococcota bacterium]